MDPGSTLDSVSSIYIISLKPERFQILSPNDWKLSEETILNFIIEMTLRLSVETIPTLTSKHFCFANVFAAIPRLNLALFGHSTLTFLSKFSSHFSAWGFHLCSDLPLSRGFISPLMKGGLLFQFFNPQSFSKTGDKIKKNLFSLHLKISGTKISWGCSVNFHCFLLN